MPFGNYTQLQQSIKDWLRRSDVDSYVPDFVALAETKIASDLMSFALKPRQMEASVSGSAAATIAIPANLLAVRRFYVTVGGRSYPLKYISPHDSAGYYGAGQPFFYTQSGDNYEIKPVPSGNATYQIDYYKKIDPLASAVGGVNWLLAASPNAYFYASLLAAVPYLKDEPRASIWASAYQTAIEDLRNVVKADRAGGGTMTMHVTGAR